MRRAASIPVRILFWTALSATLAQASVSPQGVRVLPPARTSIVVAAHGSATQPSFSPSDAHPVLTEFMGAAKHQVESQKAVPQHRSWLHTSLQAILVRAHLR